MKEKLEQMQKIYKISKVEPDFVHSVDMTNHIKETQSAPDHFVSLETKILDSSGYDIGNKNCEFQPYYPLEQVLKELPEKIEKKRYPVVEATPELIEPYPGASSGMSEDQWYRMEESCHKGIYEDVVFHLVLRKSHISYERYCKYEGSWEEDLYKEVGEPHIAALSLWLKVLEEEVEK